jgi:hypothetical protein
MTILSLTKSPPVPGIRTPGYAEYAPAHQISPMEILSHFTNPPTRGSFSVPPDHLGVKLFLFSQQRNRIDIDGNALGTGEVAGLAKPRQDVLQAV